MTERRFSNESNPFKADGMFAALENWRLNFDYSGTLTLSLATELFGGKVARPVYYPSGLPFDKLPAGVDPHTAGWRIEISSVRRFGTFGVSRAGVIEQLDSGPPEPRDYGLVPDVSGQAVAFVAAGNLIRREDQPELFANAPPNLVYRRPVPLPPEDQALLADFTARIRRGFPE